MVEKSGDSLRVLIVNDDGIDAPGIQLLEKIVGNFTSDIWVVAPDEERSGTGHSLSLSYPIRIKQLAEQRFAVKGTPTDCALLGIHELMGDRRPDIILSGINRGPNLAEDVTYSGTASAAMEGAMLGVPAIALSQVWSYQTEVQWATSEKYGTMVLDELLSAEWVPNSFVNVNFPHCPPEAVTGIRVTTQGMRSPGTFRPIRRVDERHIPYYWIKVAYTEGGALPGTDLEAIADNAVSITPMQLNMTDEPLRARLAERFSRG